MVGKAKGKAPEVTSLFLCSLPPNSSLGQGQKSAAKKCKAKRTLSRHSGISIELSDVKTKEI